MGARVTLSTPPWEEVVEAPTKRRTYPRRRFANGTLQVEKYRQKKQLTANQYDAAIELLSSLKDATDPIRSFNALSKSIPPEYWAYVRWSVVENKSLFSMAGCSGGANFARYLCRLSKGLDALSVYLKNQHIWKNKAPWTVSPLYSKSAIQKWDKWKG